jgi:hypothetical protein
MRNNGHHHRHDLTATWRCCEQLLQEVPWNIAALTGRLLTNFLSIASSLLVAFAHSYQLVVRFSDELFTDGGFTKFEVRAEWRMEISWTDHVRNEVLHRVKEERNILRTIKRRKANRIGHILRRNCLLKHVIEGKLEGRIEMTGRRGRRRKQLLDDLKEKRSYLKLKEEALDRTLWRTRFGRGYGPVVRQTTE